MKLLGVRWFSGQQCVGLVRVEHDYDGIVYYIGVAMGGDEDIDTEHIMAWGARFPNDAGDLLFGVKNEPTDA
jgi:hypothetical protein